MTPNDSGFTLGEYLPQVNNAVLSQVARDRNGDVWLAWWTYFNGLFWMHSYNRATASTPRLIGYGRNRIVTWELSEPAPESWWAVLRARGNGPFEEVGRVRASSSTNLLWADTAPPAGVLRYRIRRESVDLRYQWLSGEARWPPQSRRPLCRPLSANPVAEPLQLEVVDAAPGTAELTVYDLQGRTVHRAPLGITTNPTLVRLDPRSWRANPGIYFVRVVDAAATHSEAARIVVLR